MFNNDKCPYCGADIEINHDDGYGTYEDVTYQQECSKCGKIFVFTTSIVLYYRLKKAPCLNGGEHKWKDINCGNEHFVYRRICEYCGEFRQKVNPE
jgi:hypothetical protein